MWGFHRNHTKPGRRKRTAFTLVELLVVIGIVALLIAMLLPSLSRAREISNRVKCASNLRQIGQAIVLYCNDNNGYYPRTCTTASSLIRVNDSGFVASGAQFWGVLDPFSQGTFGTCQNNVPQALFLLIRTEHLSSAVFVCPSSLAIPDDYGGGSNTPLSQPNFTSIPKNLSYSYANPYPDATGADNFKMVAGMAPTFAVAADINPGTTSANNTDNVLAPTSASSPLEMRLGNSNNHAKSGQNVLYADSHVEFQNNPFAGTQGDNIYTRGGTTWNAPGQSLLDSPYAPNDSVLLPTDDDY